MDSPSYTKFQTPLFLFLKIDLAQGNHPMCSIQIASLAVCLIFRAVESSVRAAIKYRLQHEVHSTRVEGQSVLPNTRGSSCALAQYRQPVCSCVRTEEHWPTNHFRFFGRSIINAIQLRTHRQIKPLIFFANSANGVRFLLTANLCKIILYPRLDCEFRLCASNGWY